VTVHVVAEATEDPWQDLVREAPNGPMRLEAIRLECRAGT
jgi:hypothetical protein